MPGQDIELKYDGNATHAYLATPASGTGPGLIVLQEWWGLVPHIRQVADRFAEAGFVTLAPDLFKGKTTDSPGDAGRMMMALQIDETARALRAAAEHLLDSAGVTSAKVGTLGFCMGGQLALFMACEHPDLVGAAVSFYGIHPKVKLRLEKLQAPVLCHFGKHDSFVKEEDARALVQRIEEAGKHVEAHFYDAGHAFFNDSRPGAYSPEDARRAWELSVEFLSGTLQAGA